MSSAAVPVSASPRISDKALVRVQAWSGLAFATFLVLHLANMAAAVLGAAAYDGFMRVMRFYYQFPLVEIVCVLSAAIVHMGAGVTRIVRRRKHRANAAKPSLRVRLHRYSGYFMMLAFAGHVSATRLPSLYGETVDFTFINFSLTYAGIFFFPYYVLLATSGLYHMTHGGIAALRIVGARLPKGATSARSRVFWGWAMACVTVAVLGVLALGGLLYEAEQSRAAEWMTFYEDLLPAGWAPW